MKKAILLIGLVLVAGIAHAANTNNIAGSNTNQVFSPTVTIVGTTVIANGVTNTTCTTNVNYSAVAWRSDSAAPIQAQLNGLTNAVGQSIMPSAWTTVTFRKTTGTNGLKSIVGQIH